MFTTVARVGRAFALCAVDNDLAVAHLGFRHLLQYLRGLLFGHFKERAVGRQVDAADVDLALHVAVDEVDDFAGIEIVALAEVDEEALVARFGFARTARSVFAAGTVGLGTLLVVAAALRLLDLGRVGIILQEMSELATDDALDEVFLREPVELAEDFWEEGGDLRLVDLNAFQFVHHAIELFRADFLGLGQYADLEFLADDFLDDAHFSALAEMDDGDARAALSGASSTSRTVGIVFYVVGKSVVDHVCQFVDIKTAGCHVGGNEELRAVLTELLHREVALGLREVAVEGFGVVAVADEEVGHFLCLHTGATEDDAVAFRIIVDHAFQREVFVFGVYEIIDVVDVFGAFVA